MDFLSSLLPHGQSVLSVIIVLGALIFFHELGHFLVARALGIGVVTFSLGFGPKLIKKQYGKTEYCLSLIPLGGYCALAGEEDGEEDEDEIAQNGIVFEPHERFNLHPAWHRLLVALAGSAFNILLAVIIYFGITLSQGTAELLPVIGEVNPESPAATANLQKNDRILSINDKEISTWSEIADAIKATGGNVIELTLLREGEELSVTLSPEQKEVPNIFGEMEKTWLIGISSGGELEYRPLGFFEALSSAFSRTWGTIAFTFESLAKLVQGAVPLNSLGGPVMIAQIVGQQAHEGIVNLLFLTALISINLGIFNLLPIPVLDGGLIIFFAIEMIVGRPVNERFREMAGRVGMVFLIGLMLFATFNDLVRLF